MRAAVAAMLEGMPEPRDLRLHRPGGRCVIAVGGTVLFDYDAADTLMRNVAISALRQLGFTGRRGAPGLGLGEDYVATLPVAALREGSAALIRHAGPGRPSKLGLPDWASAAAWRGQGLSDAEIGRRLGIAHTTVARRLGPRPAQPAAGVRSAGPAGSQCKQKLPAAQPEPEPAPDLGPAGGEDPGATPEASAGTEPQAGPGLHGAPAAGAGEVPPGLRARAPREVAGPVAASVAPIAAGRAASRHLRV